jgi:hypothetical protein
VREDYRPCFGAELVSMIAGWVDRLGHVVRGWMFMFVVVVSGEVRSWVLAHHLLDHFLFSM